MTEFWMLICGSRTFGTRAHYEAMAKALSAWVADQGDALGSVRVLHGGARGADTLGGRWARANGYPVLVMPADWDRYGRSAGYRRNREMAEHLAGLPARCFAFTDKPLAESRGTAHMVDLALSFDIPVTHFQA